MTRKKSNMTIPLRSLLVMAGILISLAGGAGLDGKVAIIFAAENLQSKETQELMDSLPLDIVEDDGFVYKREGRSDPFVPFLTEPAKVVQTEVVEEELTGMRKFEPGQLMLVAIVFRGNKSLAMVQDPVGKGYIIHKGTKIGRVGVVDDIAPNRVIINNITYTRTGEKRYNKVEMLLKKEGEKQ